MRNVKFCDQLEERKLLKLKGFKVQTKADKDLAYRIESGLLIRIDNNGRKLCRLLKSSKLFVRNVEGPLFVPFSATTRSEDLRFIIILLI